MSATVFSLSVLCPCYNEEAALPAFFEAIEPVLESITGRYEIVCVDDGSSDGTLALLMDAARRNPRIRVIELSRNFGKEAALTCGLDHANGDAVVPIDTDLQDPPELIREMVEKWRQGYDVVLARRVDRSTDGFAKRASASLFYRIHNRISDSTIPDNVGDFRLMDRQVVEAVRSLPEHRRFMKGIFAWVGFRTTTITYARPERVAGTTKFNAWRLWNFALEGITSFSTWPLRVWSYLGLMVAGTAFIYGSLIVLRTLLLGVDVPGYASLLVSVQFLGGIQLIGMGILGEYIGRIYQEAKRRPVYLVRQNHAVTAETDR